MESLVTKANVTVRPATLADMAFIDALQKAHHKQLGFFPRQQMEEYIASGGVLIAEEKFGVGSLAFGVEERSSELQTPNAKLQTTQPLGYVASRDRYLKRDELGAIFQMCVAPGNQRKFVAATLLHAVFDRAPYGCKLYCCWCAQDIEANRFWEAMGFVPLAFRAGSEKKARVHIFWQKRIRADDNATPYWFPSQTTGGAIGAGRIVLPIPPGTHWSDAKPLILPSTEAEAAKRLPKPKQFAPTSAPPKRGPISGLSFIRAAQSQPAPKAKAVTPPKPKAPKPKNDPKLIAAARELRDRWLEQVNSGEAEDLVPQIAAKYDVRREVSALKKVEAIDVAPVRLLEAA